MSEYTIAILNSSRVIYDAKRKIIKYDPSRINHGVLSSVEIQNACKIADSVYIKEQNMQTIKEYLEIKDEV